MKPQRPKYGVPKRKKEYGPIPFVISFELAFIEEGLTEEQYIEEVRRVVREKLPDVLQNKEDQEEAGLWEEYDDRISKIIEEELARN
jgi:hypothetical protein